MEKESMPLVSVRILTYNSSKYIIETLDSVLAQTYSNIELVVSDDCSKDDTVDLCKKWIQVNRNRFANVVLLTSTVNTGVCENSKRSLEAASGEWIKGLGGDDLLTPSAIEEFVSFVLEHKCEICASRLAYINESGEDMVIRHGLTHEKYMTYLQLPYKGQFRICKQRIIVPGPVLFYSRKVLQATGLPDGRYGAADEWSFLYKVIKAGFRIFGVDEVLVKYRVNHKSLTHGRSREKTPYYRECNRRFLKEVIMPDLKHDREWLLLWHAYLQCHVMEGKKALNLLDPIWYKTNALDSLKVRMGLKR